MTIALFLLAAAGPCAAATLCPSHRELVALVKAEADAAVQSVSNTISRDHPGDIVFAHAYPIKNISDMVCGEALADAPRSMNCKFTVHYARSVVYRIATFIWQDGHWAIAKDLSVVRQLR
jgi:hypothetical protein